MEEKVFVEDAKGREVWEERGEVSSKCMAHTESSAPHFPFVLEPTSRISYKKGGEVQGLLLAFL